MRNQNPFSADSRERRHPSPDQIGDTPKVTAPPTYLIALTAIVTLKEM